MSDSGQIRIYAHTKIFYWWAVWLAGFVCAGLTYFFGETATLAGLYAGRTVEVLVHPNPWLGFSFILLLLTTLTVTNINFRGQGAFLFIAVVAIILFAIFSFVDFGETVGQLTVPPVYLSFAFYISFASVVFVVWLVSVFFVSRLEYWSLDRNLVGHYVFWGDGLSTTQAHNVQIRKKVDDVFSHWILGLRWLGFGTGDILIRYDNAGQREQHLIENVWNVNRTVRKIERRISVSTIE